ncbi:acetylserotonin O-methyltransferase [Desmonostoc muscorum LEGE 12446]|uniref:Methyltransferase domain-containing protein n=1 Tax=Desmonostoc muscorum LEGE 12446 TaxID=1828758 RepID=A0A8J7AF10_DESMC|nr:methyltransferase [Desmonostoc muscorum]MCF2150816.1 acetylserotonin O-methyltransferase [Desmonostoc muscorum LEGE 12446]
MFQTEAIHGTIQTNLNLPEKLLQMSNGTFVTQAIYVAAKLGIADLLKDGAKSSDELAKLTDVDAQSLYRMMRALCSISIFTEVDDRKFQLTPLGECLQTDIPGSMRAFAIALGEPWFWQACGSLLESIKTGKNVFENLYGMEDRSYLMQHPEIVLMLQGAINAFTTSLIPTMLASYDFSAFSKIVDVGCGQGALMVAILKANPTMKGILFDQPPIVQGAKHLLKAKGVAERCEIVGGDFLQFVPKGGDGYILKHILHICDDKNALAILKNCHQAMVDNGKLIVFEAVIPSANQPSLSKWFDLHMLLMGDGRERTETEYRELLAAAGFMVRKVFSTQAPVDVIEAVKV